jgi:hypothetical protein
MHEVDTMKQDEMIMRRIIKSYQLMLDFYGMKLENEATGLISRSKDYQSRYKNLSSTYSSRPDPSPDRAIATRRIPCMDPCLEILSYPSVHFVSPKTKASKCERY